MAIKTVAQMFGDNAGNGAAVPYSTANPPGTAAANRGIQFGEQLTAAIANRTHVALCLNDEDLNTRLVDWETNGLDAAYRLGAVNTAGGGRVITVDGAAVELQTSLAASYAQDPMNAALRVDHSDDAIAGSVGVDLLAEYTQLPYANLSVRRTQDLTTASIADPETGTLNSGASDVDGLTLGAGNNNSTLIPGVDLIELTNTAYAGIYAVLDRVSTTGVTLRGLSGGTPSFVADTAVSYRVWRQTTRIGSRATVNAAFLGGVVLSDALDFDGTTAVLTLVPTAPFGRGSSAGTGAHFALDVKHNLSGVLESVFKVDSLGTCVSQVSTDSGTSAQKDRAVNFGVPAFYSSRLGDWGAGYVAFNDDPTKRYFGGLFQSRGDLTQTVDLDGDEVIPTSILGYGVNGQLFEVVSPSTHAGIYMIQNTATTPWIARTLDGASPAWSSVSDASIRVLEGLSIGRAPALPVVDHLDLVSPGSGVGLGVLRDQVTSQVRITSPHVVVDAATTPTALVLQKGAEDMAAYLRCFNRDDLGEDFAVTGDGSVVARGVVQAASFHMHPAKAVTDRLLPLDAWNGQQASSDGVASKWTRRQGRWVYDRGAGPTAATPEDLICCISDILPIGAIVTQAKVRYQADATYVNAMMRLRLSTLDFSSDGAFTNVETFFLDAFTSYTTQTYTFASPQTVDKEGSTKVYLRFDPNSFAATPCFISIASVSVDYTYRQL